MNQWTKERREPTLNEAITFIVAQASFNPYKSPGTMECVKIVEDWLDKKPEIYTALYDRPEQTL